MTSDQLTQAMCATVLAAVDHEIMLLGQGGRVVFANECARETLGIDNGHPIHDLVAPIDDNLRTLMTHAAQSSSFVPINLQVAKGEYQGLDVKFRARGVRHPDTQGPLLMLLADRKRDDGFKRLKGLVRELNQELAERRRLQIKLEDALHSEQRLHGELIHRVKNNLTLLNSLIHFRQKSSDNPEVLEALSSLEHRIHAILAVHEILDRAGEIDWVQAGDLIRALCHQLEKSLAPDHIEIENDLLDVEIPVQDATPLALLINELITNAIKHAFPGGKEGTVRVALKKNGKDKLEVNVADDGHGIVNGRNQGSGSRLIRAFAQQIGGKLERHSDDDGTTWTLVFPYNAPSETRDQRRIELPEPPQA